jgi:hypothetical protein
MSKKTETSAKKNDDVSKKAVRRMQNFFRSGNFFAARKEAHSLLKNTSDAEEKKTAQQILKMTGLETTSLLVGALIATIPLTVAFLIAY